MNDAEYLFNQTSRERAIVASGDKHKKRGGGRYVRLPSDNLSRKERQAMNGEVITFDPREFYTWEEFKTFPDDLQLKYVNSIINRYGVGIITISEIVFQKSANALSEYLRKKGLSPFVNKSGGSPKEMSASREKLKNDVNHGAGTTETSEKPADAPLPPQDCTFDVAPCDDTPEAENKILGLSELLRLLAGTGAKLTIEVTL